MNQNLNKNPDCAVKTTGKIFSGTVWHYFKMKSKKMVLNLGGFLIYYNFVGYHIVDHA